MEKTQANLIPEKSLNRVLWKNSNYVNTFIYIFRIHRIEYIRLKRVFLGSKKYITDSMSYTYTYIYIFTMSCFICLMCSALAFMSFAVICHLCTFTLSWIQGWPKHSECWTANDKKNENKKMNTIYSSQIHWNTSDLCAFPNRRKSKLPEIFSTLQHLWMAQINKWLHSQADIQTPFAQLFTQSVQSLIICFIICFVFFSHFDVQ